MTFMARERRKTMAYVGDMTDLDDPAFAIQWPAVDRQPIVSQRDRSYPDFRP